MNENRIHIGFIGGFDLAGNVVTFLKNVRRILSMRETSFDCDLVCSPPSDAPAGFRTINIDAPTPNTARDRIQYLTSELRRYVISENPDVIFQITMFPSHGTATAIAGRLTGTPTITRLAAEDFCEHKFANEVLEKTRLYLLKNVIGQAAVHLPDGVIVLGPNGRRSITRRFRRRNVWAIPQPIDREQFSPVSDEKRAQIRRELGMPQPERGTVLLTVGRVTHRKGAQTILRTADALPDDVTWYVVGDGQLREELEAIPNVRTVGRVPHDRIQRYYRAADLYIHPTLHDGLPNVLLEATGCGTPSIARNVGECKTIATETFDNDDELLELIEREYDRVNLDGRFDEDRLGARYESALREVTE